MSNPNATPAATANWTEQKGKLKAKFSNLTDADLNYEESKKEEMIGKIQSKLGKTREEMTAIIAGL